MPEHIARISNELHRLIISLWEMQKNESPYKARKAIFEIGCELYGRANIIEFATGICALDIINPYLKRSKK